MSPKRPMRRVGDMLPGVAAELGIQDELRRARQLTAWERVIAEHIPAAAGGSRLLSLQPPALVVSASSPGIAQELRLRQAELLAAFAQAPEGVRMLELRVAVRPPTIAGGPDDPGRSGGRTGRPR